MRVKCEVIGAGKEAAVAQLNVSCYSAFAWRDWWKSQQTSIGIFVFPSDIRNGHFLNEVRNVTSWNIMSVNCGHIIIFCRRKVRSAKTRYFPIAWFIGSSNFHEISTAGSEVIKRAQLVTTRWQPNVEFEVFTALLITMTVYWAMTTCWLVTGHRRFGRSCRFLQTVIFRTECVLEERE